MPTFIKRTTMVYGESQGSIFIRCKKEDDMRTFINNRGYQLWRKFHDKRCDCMKKSSTTDLEATKRIGDKLGINRENAEHRFK